MMEKYDVTFAEGNGRRTQFVFSADILGTYQLSPGDGGNDHANGNR